MEKITVVTVDDTKEWLFFHKKILTYLLANYDVDYITFSSAKDCHEFLTSYDGNVDLFITDLEMEPMEILAGEWLLLNTKDLPCLKNTIKLIISASPSIKRVSKTTDTPYLSKVNYHANPMLLKYKLERRFANVK
ncbi:MAG: hypothetical protein PHX18_03090 [Candidatus Gastranaerophilales bacterium]|nr:hypothetical protein [Candidatus Gastranaerophilales bacterium]